MYIVTVIFEYTEANAAAFRARMLQQATDSLENEIGCRQFDVSFSVDDTSKCFLYEKYDDQPAFDEHLASDHFKDFDKTVKPWIVNKQVSIWKQ